MCLSTPRCLWSKGCPTERKRNMNPTWSPMITTSPPTPTLSLPPRQQIQQILPLPQQLPPQPQPQQQPTPQHTPLPIPHQPSLTHQKNAQAWSTTYMLNPHIKKISNHPRSCIQTCSLTSRLSTSQTQLCHTSPCWSRRLTSPPLLLPLPLLMNHRQPRMPQNTNHIRSSRNSGRFNPNGQGVCWKLVDRLYCT